MIIYPNSDSQAFWTYFVSRIKWWFLCVVGISTVPTFIASCVAWLEGNAFGAGLIPNGDAFIIAAAVAGDAIYDKIAFSPSRKHLSQRQSCLPTIREKDKNHARKLNNIVRLFYWILPVSVFLYTLVSEVKDVAEYRGVQINYLSLAILVAAIALNIAYRKVKELYEWDKSKGLT